MSAQASRPIRAKAAAKRPRRNVYSDREEAVAASSDSSEYLPDDEDNDSDIMMEELSDPESDVDDENLDNLIDAAAAASAEGNRGPPGRNEGRKRRSSQLLPAQLPKHPAAGVKIDVEKFLQAFSDRGVARFTSFAELFRQMEMGKLYHGRCTIEELLDMSQCLMHLLVLYTQPAYPALVRIGGLYLLYSYFVRISKLVAVRIRVTAAQWLRLCELRQRLLAEQHCDAFYVLQYLELHRAFVFCAVQHHCYPFAPLPLCPEDELSNKDTFASELLPLVQVVGKDKLEILRELHSQYYKMKNALKTTSDCPALEVVEADALDCVENSLIDKEVKQEVQLAGGSADADRDVASASPGIGEMRKKLVAKAFSFRTDNA